MHDKNQQGVYTPRWRGDERQRRTVFCSTIQHRDIGEARTNKTYLLLHRASQILYALNVQASNSEAKKREQKKARGTLGGGDVPFVSWASSPTTLLPPPPTP